MNETMQCYRRYGTADQTPEQHEAVCFQVIGEPFVPDGTKQPYVRIQSWRMSEEKGMKVRNKVNHPVGGKCAVCLLHQLETVEFQITQY